MKFLICVFELIYDALRDKFFKKDQNCPQLFQLTQTPLHGVNSIQIEINKVKLDKSEWILYGNNYVLLMFRPSPKDDVLVSVVYHHKGESCGAINTTWFRPNGN
jgi:hypothetical protein